MMSLNKALYNDYLCIEDSNKHQIYMGSQAPIGELGKWSISNQVQTRITEIASVNFSWQFVKLLFFTKLSRLLMGDSEGTQVYRYSSKRLFMHYSTDWLECINQFGPKYCDFSWSRCQ